MKLIKLTQGQYAQVDDKDYDFLNQWKWFALKTKNTYYAVRSEYNPETKVSKPIRMHRIILNLIDSDTLCDHEDHNGLNNQRYNLRIATRKENVRNKTSVKGSTSQYLGVSWIEKIRKWRAKIVVDKKQIRLGSFIDEKDAAKAYNLAATKYFKTFANRNQV